MNHPLLYELNTRCWLRELSELHGRPVDLGDVPPEIFADWLRLGFTHIWLMGVWTTGPRSRAVALRDPALRHPEPGFPDGYPTSEITASPYAIAGYQVSPSLGGEAGLSRFRQRLREHGLKLVLDFIPNHVGLDHPWLTEKPELFVQCRPRARGAFRQRTPTGVRWLAHGKDPYFHPWLDTAQLDYRHPETRALMIHELKDVSHRCDGVRCDMAMLLLNDVFTKTWSDFASPWPGGHREFWDEAIVAVKSEQPDFMFLAEVYWNLEARLQALGFDFTYDKHLRDLLVHHHHSEVARHLREATPGFIQASAHFLENHDETPVASLLSLAEHRPAALLMLGLPGLRLVHEGQMSGHRTFTPVQLGRRRAEPEDPQLATLYKQWLTNLRHTAVGKGESQMLQPVPAWSNNASSQYFVVVQWQLAPPEFDLVVVNLAPHRSQCRVPLTAPGLASGTWELRDQLGQETYQRSGKELAMEGLFLDLPAHGAQLFHCQPLF